MTIKFKLFDLDEITLFGDESNLSTNWFSLTDGDLWIDFGKANGDLWTNSGKANFYEYTKEAIEYFEGKSSPYNNYFISRFIDDFMWLLRKINEDVPLEIFENICDLPNLMQFLDDADRWLETMVSDKDDNDEIGRDFWNEKYYPLISWIGDRQLDSGHLQGSPKIWFFRHEDVVKIVWKADHKIEDKINMWTSQSGQRSLFYFVFEGEIKRFGAAFFQAMDKQILLAIEKDWGDVKLDKIGLLKEQRERYLDFNLSLPKLDEERTDWDKVNALIQEMKKEISK
ncbi:MAG: DUF5984 family protein [Arcicella sp.]|nr:DUF5984 family protein [Arcicella sp.]